MIRSPSVACNLLHSQTGPHTFKLASTVPTWSKPASLRPLSLLPATSSTIGPRRAAKTLLPRAVSSSQVATASSRCTSIFTKRMVCTTVPQTPLRLILILSVSVANGPYPTLLPVLPVCDAPHPDLPPPRRPDKSNQRSGCCALALRVNTNLTSSPHTSSARHLYLSTIPFSLSTLKNKPTSANRRPNALPNVSQRVGPNLYGLRIHACVLGRLQMPK